MRKFPVVMAALLLIYMCAGCTGVMLQNKNQQKVSEVNIMEDQNLNEEGLDLPTKPDEAKKSYEMFFNAPDQKPEQVKLVIKKKDRVLEVHHDQQIIGRFKVGLGFSPEGHKEREGDGKTPEGAFYICTINENSAFTLFYGLSYPGIQDAENALQEKRITQTEYNEVINAQQNNQRPPWKTDLGGEVGIHGGGDASDWTWGCIALSDENILILKEYIGINTLVEILP